MNVSIVELKLLNDRPNIDEMTAKTSDSKNK